MSNPWIRRTAIALVAAIGLSFVGAGLLIATFDADRYKSLAVDWVKDKTQRTLSIDGPIELSVFPRLAVTLSKVRLTERGGADEFAALDQASLSLRILPLLKKQLVIDRVSARGVRAVYRRNAQGVSNVDDLFGPVSGQEAAQTAQADGRAASTGWMDVDISAVQLDDLQMRIDDEASGVAGIITVPTLTSGRLASQTESPLALQASVQLTQPQTVALTLTAKTQVALDLAQRALTLRKLQLDVKGAAANVQGLALSVLAQSARLAPSAKQVEFAGLRLALSGRQERAPFEWTLDWPQLAVDAQRLDGSALQGSFKLNGATTLAGSFSSGAPSGHYDALRLPDVAVTLTGRAGDVPLAVDAKADLLLNGSARSAAWTLAGSVNRNTFDSTGRATLGARAPAVHLKARFDRLDLNTLTASPAPTDGGRAAPDAPISLEGLKALDGRFEVRAGDLIVRQYRIGNASFAATLDRGLLQIERLAGRSWGGDVVASGSVNAADRRLHGVLNASAVDVQALLKDVAGKDMLTGRGRVSADLRTRGATVGDWRRQLAGSVSLNVRDGAIKGINLAQAFRQAKAALSGATDAISQAQLTEQTDFSELSASARLTDGVAVSDDLDVKSPFLRIGGSGRFDIGAGRIDYTARASVTDSAAGQGGAQLEALRGVTVPVQLSGPFDAIDWKIQWSGVAAAAVRQQLKDKVAEKVGKELGVDKNDAKGELEKRLKDKLRDLFK